MSDQPDNENTKPFVYKWTHLPTLMWYIGVRFQKGCHQNDGYICSSKVVKPLILKHPAKWKREIIATGTVEEMLLLEAEILHMFDAKNEPRSFNQHNGDGKFVNKFRAKWTKSQREKASLKYKNISYEERHGIEKAQQIKNKLKEINTGKPGKHKGKPFTEQHKKNISSAAQARPPITAETKEKMSKSHKGRPMRQESKQKSSDTWKKLKPGRQLFGDGILYQNIRIASETLNLTPQAIRYRINFVEGWEYA